MTGIRVGMDVDSLAIHGPGQRSRGYRSGEKLQVRLLLPEPPGLSVSNIQGAWKEPGLSFSLI